MAELLKVRPKDTLVTLHDAERDKLLENGVVAIETSAPQAIFAHLSTDAIGQLATTLSELLRAIQSANATRMWSWHLALSSVPPVLEATATQVTPPPIPPNIAPDEFFREPMKG